MNNLYKKKKLISGLRTRRLVEKRIIRINKETKIQILLLLLLLLLLLSLMISEAPLLGFG